MNKSLTFTIISNMTANYGESLGNISQIQKVYKDGVAYSSRSWESIKSMLMKQAGWDKNLSVTTNNKNKDTNDDDIKETEQENENLNETKSKKKKSSIVAQKNVTKNGCTLETCKNLEGGYMLASKEANFKRDSSFRLTNAVATTKFNGDYQFHNNLKLAEIYAKDNGLNIQNDANKVGLMPYNYEYEKTLRVYSITIFLDRIGVDENFGINLSNEEKCNRVLELVNAIMNLELEVKGSLDNAEPLFIIGGLSNKKSHIFENMISMNGDNLVIDSDLIDRAKDYHIGILGTTIKNKEEIIEKLNAVSMKEFLDNITKDVKNHFNV